MRWYFLLCLYLLNGIQDSVAAKANSVKPGAELFKETDPVNILNFDNFDAQILYKPYSQFVLFYDKYDVKSQYYAVEYKNIAVSLLPARQAVQFDAIDCSEDRNVQVCFKSLVEEYPTISYFHQFINRKDDLGEDIEKPSNKNDVIRILKIFRKDLFPIENIDTVNGIVSKRYENVICIFEESSSLLGPQVMVDLFESSHLLVRRGYTNNPLAYQLRIYNFPTTVGYSKKSNFSVPNILTFQNSNDKEVEKAIREYVHSDRNKPISYNDLEIAIRTSLEVEATSHFLVKGDTDALLNYLMTLIDLFPAEVNLRLFLDDLYRNLTKKPEWDNKEVYDLIQHLEVKHYPVFLAPIPARYETCSGDGYTCALWLLFHTLLGQADHGPLKNYGPMVLQAMNGYTKHFQQDRTRAEHFKNAKEFYNISDVRNNKEARLWLWWVHNQIRKLENDTSMTKPPDVIYPTLEQCPMCRHEKLLMEPAPKINTRNLCKVCDPNQDAGKDSNWIIGEVDDFLDKRFGYGRIEKSKFEK